MLPETFLEQQNRVRSEFAEVFFLLMRHQRYGISNCTECGDVDLLAAQQETLMWKEEKDRDEAIDEIDSES